MNKMNFLKKILIFIFIFLLFYFEPVKIGSITFSQLWKIPLFIYLVFQVLILKKHEKPAFIIFSYARAGKHLINGGLFINYFEEVVNFIRYMMFPLIYEFILIKVKNIAKLDKLLLGYSQFIILSGIPFVLGLLKSEGEILSNYYFFPIYRGIFQNVHGASITTATAILILLALLKSKSIEIQFKSFNYLLVFFGIYLLYLTFVRTGYAMFIIGIIVLYLPKKISIKQITGSVISLLLLIFVFIYLLKNNELFYNRIFDIRNGHQTEIGSGRLLFWSVAADLWLHGNFFELLFGHGYIGLLNRMYETLKMAVFAHNEFFNQLAQNGLIGVMLFLGFIIKLLQFIWKRRKMPSYRLATTVLALYFSLMMTQGGMWFSFDLLIAMVYVKLEMEYRNFNKNLIIAYSN